MLSYTLRRHRRTHPPPVSYHRLSVSCGWRRAAFRPGAGLPPAGGPTSSASTNRPAAHGASVHYLRACCRGDFGRRSDSATHRVRASLPRPAVSATRGLAAILLPCSPNSPGHRGALWRNAPDHHHARGLSLALPSFVTGPLVRAVFDCTCSWLPVAGLAARRAALSGCCGADAALPVARTWPRDSPAPVWLEVLSAHYVRSARAGLGTPRVLWRHCAAPGPDAVGATWSRVAFVMTGSSWSSRRCLVCGTGRYLVEGAIDRDYPRVMGHDRGLRRAHAVSQPHRRLIYGWLDPGVRMHEQRHGPARDCGGDAGAPHGQPPSLCGPGRHCWHGAVAVLAPHWSPWGYDSLTGSTGAATRPHRCALVRHRPSGRDLFVTHPVRVRLSLFISVLAAGSVWFRGGVGAAGSRRRRTDGG